DDEPRRFRGHDEGRNASRACLGTGAREYAVEVGDAAVRDPGLAAVEAPAVAIVARSGGQRADVGTGVRLGERERSDGSAVGYLGEPARRCTALPPSTIGAAPSPCIAKAKSARPS